MRKTLGSFSTKQPGTKQGMKVGILNQLIHCVAAEMRALCERRSSPCSHFRYSLSILYGDFAECTWRGQKVLGVQQEVPRVLERGLNSSSPRQLQPSPLSFSSFHLPAINFINSCQTALNLLQQPSLATHQQQYASNFRSLQHSFNQACPGPLGRTADQICPPQA